MKPLIFFTLPLVSLLACGDKKTTDTGFDDTAEPVDTGADDTGSEDTGTAAYDSDGDGFTVEDGDCNDEDASIYPGAPEDYTDGIDQDCDGYADVGYTDCYTQFLVKFSGVDIDGDGVSDSSEEITLDFCQKWSMTNTYEYDPDNPPELNSIVLDLNTTDDEDFQCQLRIEETGVCGAGYYRMGVETGTTYFASMGCSGVSDENEAEFTFADGYLRLDVIATENESGSFSGIPIRTKVDAYLHVWGDEIDIEGYVELEAEQLGGDSVEGTCALVDVDADQDGYVSEYFGGQDCNDDFNYEEP